MQRLFATLPWYIAIFVIFIVLILTSYSAFTAGVHMGSSRTTETVSHETPAENDPNTAEQSIVGKEWLTYYNHEYRFFIDYPKALKFEESDGEALVVFYDPNWKESGVTATKIYRAFLAEAPTFEMFVDEITTTYIPSLIESYNEVLEGHGEPLDPNMYEGHYTFEKKIVHGVPVLIHTRDFLGETDSTTTETYVWLGEGEYLVIVGAGVELNTLYFEPKST